MTENGKGRGDPARRVGRELSPEEDVRREIHAHIDMKTEELVASGLDPSAAREEAWRMFGDEERLTREAERMASRGRDAGKAPWGEALRQDLGYAFRSLIRSPGFAFVAILTLALGIGANAGIFSLVRGVLLRPLPFADPERIVWVAETTGSGSRTMAVAWPNVLDWRERSRSFDGLAPYASGTALVIGAERPLRAGVARVGRDFWRVFPLVPVLGRLTGEEDHRFGVEPAAVVSHRFWREELGSAAVGDLTLEVTGFRVRVVGVLPEGFDFPAGTDVWAPAEVDETNASRSAHNWQVVGRLAPGVSVETAEEEIRAITLDVVADAGDDPAYLADGARVMPLRERMVGSARQPLLLLLGAAGLVLLVACTNLASTLLARGAVRGRELAVRACLGAARGRLVRQLLTESMVLSLLGAGAGAGLAVLLVRALRALDPSAVPRLAEIRVDGSVIAFTAAVALVTALVFGLLPALRLSNQRPGGALGSGSRGNALGARGPLWRLLVGTEVALALVLLTGSGLLVRSFREVLAQDPGFDESDVLAIDLDLSRIKYPSAADHVLWTTSLLERVEALPGVSRAAVASAAPLVGGLPTGRMELDGDPDKFADGGYVAVSPGFFEALDVPVLQGRIFDGQDVAGAPHVAVVSRAFADSYWPGEDPVGKQVTGGGMDDLWQERTFSTVVGLVGDIRYRDLSARPVPTVYFPASQRPFRLQWGAQIVVEAASGRPASLAPALRAAAAELDPDAALRIRTMEEVVSSSLAGRRFPMLVLGGFALVALLLAVVGIYGVVSYGVARRTREMGIRMALGAAPERVLRQVVRESLGMVVGGLVLGILGSLALSRFLTSLLYDVGANDPLTLLATVTVLLGAGALASWLPARASTRIDPMVTMRGE